MPIRSGPTNLRVRLQPEAAPLERQCRHQGWVLPDPRRWERCREALNVLRQEGVLAHSDWGKLERRLTRAIGSSCAPITYS